MSVLEEVRALTRAAHAALDQTETSIVTAVGMTGVLRQSAAGHGWAGIARLIGEADAAVAAAGHAVNTSLTAATDGLNSLATITAEMSSDEVDRHLSGGARQFEAAHQAARLVLRCLNDARTHAQRTDAVKLDEVLMSAEADASQAQDLVGRAAERAASEAAEAADWGSSEATWARAAGGPGRRGTHLAEPGNIMGPMGEHFRAGVHDENRFLEKERTVAEWLHAQDPDLSIHARKRDPADRNKNPDALIRRRPHDWGTITEFKTLETGTDSAVKSALRRANKQLRAHGNGDAVIDGRRVGLTESAARRGYTRFRGEREGPGDMPQRITVILGDGRALTWRTDV
jgi:hypothetical protein